MNLPKKSLGQHWLNDSNSLQAMCDVGMVHHHDVVLEIGPGEGTLTALLVKKAGSVIAVELDARLSGTLKKRINNPNLVVVKEDILRFDLTKLPANYKVIANIPYYLTSNLVRVLCESANSPKIVTLLVQKEVAQRLAAKPGDMSLLGVSAQMYYETSLHDVVPAELFTPPPKVDSQIVRLIRRPTPLFGDTDPKRLFQVVKAGFANRRKTLLNSLSAGLHLQKEKTHKLLEAANINPQARPQDLSLDDWLNLSRTVSNIKK